MNLIIGNYYQNVKCESFVDSETGRIRVRPLDGQSLPNSIVIECSKAIRESHAVGTVFVAEDVKVCKKPNGRIYLRAKNQHLEKI